MQEEPGRIRRFDPKSMKKVIVAVLIVCLALIAGVYFTYEQPNQQAMDFLKRHNIPVTFISNVDRNWGDTLGITNSSWWEITCGFVPVNAPWNSTICDIWINLKTDQYHIVSVVIP